MFQRWRAVMAGGFGVVLAGTTALGQSRRAGDVATEAAVFQHRWGEYSGEKGTLWVPENRSAVSSRLIELAFVRLKSTNPTPGPVIFYLSGGPGDSATAMARGPGWTALLEVSDLVLLDQRGCGSSKPALAWAPQDMSPAPLFGDPEGALKAMAEVARSAKAHFDAEGVDLTGYNTVENAADVDALRGALGSQRMSLIGHSYGTHLGLEVVRRHGANVDRFVSVGTAGTGDMHRLPAELDGHVRALATIVAADPAVGKDVPDLEALLRRVLEKVSREPVRVRVRDRVSGGEVEVPVGVHGVRFIVLRDLGDIEDIPVLPRLLYSIDKGETEPLRWFVQKRYDQMRVLPVMTLVMRGASGATQERWKMIRAQAETSLFGMARVTPWPEVAEALGVRDLGDGFRMPVQSEVPALFISGTLDANTPPEQAERVRAGFANSGHLIVENGGHEDLLGRAEVRAAILRLLQGGKPESGRVQAPPVKFIPVTGVATGHPSLEG